MGENEEYYNERVYERLEREYERLESKLEEQEEENAELKELYIKTAKHLRMLGEHGEHEELAEWMLAQIDAIPTLKPM